MALPLLSFLTFCVQLVYPLWSSFHALFGKEQMNGPRYREIELTQWTVYWIIYVLYDWIESNILFFLSDYLPLYGEIKLVLFVWLIYPDFQGAAWLWYTLLEKPFKQADEVVVDFFETRLQILLGFALGSRADASATKSEKFNQARTNPVFPTPTTPAPTTTPPVTATTPMPVNATHSNPQSAE